MILKPYEIKDYLNKNKVFLFHGENFGQKEEIIEELFKKNFKDCNYLYSETEILNNLEILYNLINSKSFFENKKLIIINSVSEKFLEHIEYILNKDLEDVTLVLITDVLTKKSKMRTFFEKSKELIIIPFYKENVKTLSDIVKKFFYEKKISISQEMINLIVEKTSGDRKNLKNELEKIESFLITNKKINEDDIIKLTNLSENFSINELVNNCLARNSKRTVKIINENIFSFEDSIIIIRLLLNSSNRLINLIKKKEDIKNIDQIISNHRPPIFWKDKDIIKKQMLSWTDKSIQNLIFKINQIELVIKKNSNNALKIVFDFLIEQSSSSNN